MNNETVRETGYRLLKLFAYEQMCEMADQEEAEGLPLHRAPNFYWNWFPSGYREFSVWLGVFLPPSSEVPERVRVAYIADFSIDADEPRIPLESFVLHQAPTLIYPYLREAVTSLTARGVAGPYTFSTLDVREALLPEFSFANSTGTEMLRDVEEAELFGFTVTLPAKPRRSKPQAKPTRATRER